MASPPFGVVWPTACRCAAPGRFYALWQIPSTGDGNGALSFRKLSLEPSTCPLPFFKAAFGGTKALYTFFYRHKPSAVVSLMFIGGFDAFYHYELAETLAEHMPGFRTMTGRSGCAGGTIPAGNELPDDGFFPPQRKEITGKISAPTLKWLARRFFRVEAGQISGGISLRPRSATNHSLRSGRFLFSCVTGACRR